MFIYHGKALEQLQTSSNVHPVHNTVVKCANILGPTVVPTKSDSDIICLFV